MALEVYKGSFGKNELTHLLKRCLFGVTRADVSSLLGKSLNEVVDYLLLDSSLPMFPINNYNDGSANDATIPAGGVWVNAPYGDGTINSRRVTSFKSWWTGQMLTQNVSLREKMVLFWHNHFATETAVISDARYIFKQNNLFRTLAFGSFKEMVKQITIDPGMLRYLNGYLNTKTAPDENYGRELQELFTMGKGPDAKFTEADVKAAARLLTGYRVDSVSITSIFDTTRHDTTDKQFSAFYNNKLIKGRIGVDGAKEVDDIVDMLFMQNQLALHVCRRLYTFFVYYDITPAVEQNVIIPLAEIFRTNNYQIKPVLKALFTSNDFFTAQNRSCNIKSPIDLVVGLCREFEIVFPDGLDYVNLYYMWDYIRGQASTIQQNIGDPPNVAGWPAYYQSPQFYELWVNSDTLPKRNSFTDRFISAGYTRNNKKIIIDPLVYTAKFSKPEDPDQLINDVIDHLYTLAVSAQVKTFLKSILLSNQASNIYWTEAWTNYKLDPTNTGKINIVTTRLKEFYKYIMNLEEYQLS
ncbi:MAG: DUF1800 domain-containing protein [Pedobacter sp.]|nr:DUF1800 domain-containing protein [Pedobacter sp.]